MPLVTVVSTAMSRADSEQYCGAEVGPSTHASIHPLTSVRSLWSASSANSTNGDLLLRAFPREDEHSTSHGAPSEALSPRDI
jgi:hypothetical protein